MTTGQRKPTHLVSCIKKIQVWHRRFGHASITQIIRVFKIFTDIGKFNITYNPAKINNSSKPLNQTMLMLNPNTTSLYKYFRLPIPGPTSTRFASRVLRASKHMLFNNRNR